MGRFALTSAAGLALGFILLPLVFAVWLAFFRQAIPSLPLRVRDRATWLVEVAPMLIAVPILGRQDSRDSGECYGAALRRRKPRSYAR